jgi:outer membrane lipopolysaccharide assembly protein LptE/RlpB
LLSWLVIASVLSSCGYHLRGEADIPSDMQRTYISAEDRFTGFFGKSWSHPASR